MKRTKIDMNPERLLVTNMIVSTPFLREIVPVFRLVLLKTEYAREVASWVLEYWEEYKAAPGKDIQSIYYHKKAGLRDEETAENISDFLLHLSQDWEQNTVNNVEYSVSQAIRYLKTRSLEILRDQLDDSLSSPDPIQGEQYIANYTRIAPPQGEGVDLLRDASRVAEAFLEEEEVLFQFPGALGVLAGRFHRGDFISYLAPMKRGKTHHLWYLAETGLYLGHKVLFITLEMTKNQMIRRAWQSLVGAPSEECSVTLPYFTAGSGGRWVVHTKTETRRPVDITNIERIQKIFRRQFRSGGVRIIAFPAATSVDDIEACLDNFAYYENFVPDIVVIDYADLLTPSRRFKGEYRHGVDDIWKNLRRMAQERNVLMATVSQSDRSTFAMDVTERAVAEDIRKLAHVTCMLGLSQTKTEAQQGIMRVNQIALREGRRVFESAVVLYCYDIGRAVLDSRLEHEVQLSRGPEEDEGEGDEKEEELSSRRPRFRR